MRTPDTLLDHLKALRRAARAAGAELLVAGDSMQAHLRRGESTVVLHPQFLLATPEGTRRTPRLHDESDRFLGWLPYASRHWPIAVDRLAFKRFAADVGLPVPARCDPTTPVPVVVRRTAPAFEPWVDGPFRNGLERALDAAGGEFHEAHVEGDALTAWFWGGRPVCAELTPTPTVTGDGTSRLGELLVHGAQGGEEPLPVIHARLAEGAALARLHGYGLDSVIPAGLRLTVGLGHGSVLEGARPSQVFELVGAHDAPWLPVLQRAGPLLTAALPEGARSATLFVVNATVDTRGATWLLDVDAIPRIHPLTYRPMLETLLAPSTHATTPAPDRAPAPPSH